MMAPVTMTTRSASRVRKICLTTLMIGLAFGIVILSNTLNTQEEIRPASNCRHKRQGRHHSRSGSPFRETTDGHHEWGPLVNGTSHIIYFNAIPKTGCRSIARAAAMMSAQRTEGDRLQIMVLPDNILTDEGGIRRFMETVQPPAIIGGHTIFVRFPGSQVKYINVLREPLERLVSHYYYEQNGDEMQRDGLITGKKSDMKTLDECVQDEDCRNRTYKKLLYTTVGQLCGMGPPCGSLTREAMMQARMNLDQYTVIGLTEELNTTVLLLERMFPDMMRGLYEHFRKSENESLRKFKTINKLNPSPRTMEILRSDLSLEYELYDEVKRRFDKLEIKMIL